MSQKYVNGTKLMSRVTIITAFYNDFETVGKVLRSVEDLSHLFSIEHIIVNSSPNAEFGELGKISPDLCRRVIFDEPNGVYAALNKGLRHASSEYIFILHANDYLTNVGAFCKAFEEVQDPSVDFVHSNIEYSGISSSAKITRTWNGSDFSPLKLSFGWMPAHTSIIYKKECFEKVGHFDENYKIAGDYEWLLRAFQSGMRTKYVDCFYVNMSLGGVSSGLSFLKLKEDYIAIRKYLPFPFFTLLFKRLLKLQQIRVVKV